MNGQIRFRFLSLFLLTFFLSAFAVMAQEEVAPPEKEVKESDWDVTAARGKTREIDFVTKEGTWMTVDVSPDGKWLVFDLLAHVYRLPFEGGEAQCLTQDSGVATNYHPRFSPDGRTIAFVSDRKGQNNLWIMNADGSNPHAVFTDLNVRVSEPVWTADGNYLIVKRDLIPKPGQAGASGLWMYHKDGGQGIELTGKDISGASFPATSPDGKYVYFQVTEGRATASGHRDSLEGAFQLRRLELVSGDVMEVTGGVAAQQIRSSSGGAYAPQVSPDGRRLTFARRVPDGTISYKGHKFGPRSALWIRDLESGAEKMIMDPIEQDMTEGMKTLRVLPGYAWAPDGKSIVLSQGGQLRQLFIESGRVGTIPFSARVKRTISEMAYKPFRIEDDSFKSRFMRWGSASPDGKQLLVQSVGRIWILDLPKGTPRRLTPDSFEAFELSPAWSSDGQWIAFGSWDSANQGHLWKIRPDGTSPQQITEVPAEYLSASWRPDGQELIVARGSGATSRHQSMAGNLWYDLVRIPAAGGAAELVVRVDKVGARSNVVRACYGPEGRIFYTDDQKKEGGQSGPSDNKTALISVRPDGSDKRVHLTFPFADEIVPSPDGKWVAFQEGDNVYLAPFPWLGTSGDPVHIDKFKGKLPVRKISSQGGLTPTWQSNSVVGFISGNHYFSYDTGTEKTAESAIDLVVKKASPTGTIALTGARIITLNQRRVLDKGTVLVKGSRIVCVGECATDQADRVVDVSGKTIIPGFVDMHAHHYREHGGIIPSRSYETAIYLAYGVTTNLDNSMWSSSVFPTAELIESGAVTGPRTFSTGDPLYRGDGARQNELTSYQIAEDNVERLRSWGAVSIKQYLQPRRDQRQWVSHAARKLGLMVTAEGSDLAYNLSMIMDGQTGFEHPMSYMPLYSDAATFFGQAKAVYSPTFVVGGPAAWNEEYFFQQSDVGQDPKLRRFMPWRQLVHLRRRMLRPETDYSFPLIAQGMADIIEQGGYGAIGSHGQQHGLGSHWEIWMVESAMGAMGALEVASLHGAHFLGVDKDLGSIENGKLADLVILNSNPLDDIRNTTDILYVMKGGRLYDAGTLDEKWPENKPFGDYDWVDPEIYRNDDRPVNYWDRQYRE